MSPCANAHLRLDFKVRFSASVRFDNQAGAISYKLGYGYVVIVRHKDDILSVYKNAASVTKKQGNTVKSGEVIALAGNANTVQNSGATLHFELWKDGFPIDPTQFINFN